VIISTLCSCQSCFLSLLRAGWYLKDPKTLTPDIFRPDYNKVCEFWFSYKNNNARKTLKTYFSRLITCYEKWHIALKTNGNIFELHFLFEWSLLSKCEHYNFFHCFSSFFSVCFFRRRLIASLCFLLKSCRSLSRLASNCR